MRMVGSDLRRVCLVIGGGESESPRISEVIVFATTLECDGDSDGDSECLVLMTVVKWWVLME